jgi:hypothetical protein
MTIDVQRRAKEVLDRARRDSVEKALARREGRRRGELSDSLREKLRSCNPEQLKRVKRLCDAFLSDHRQPPVAMECGQRYTIEVLANVVVKNKRYLLEKRSCGKECAKCPHGPYLYAYYRDGAIIKQLYFRTGQISKAPRKVRSVIAPFVHNRQSKRSRTATNV